MQKKDQSQLGGMGRNGKAGDRDCFWVKIMQMIEQIMSKMYALRCQLTYDMPPRHLPIHTITILQNFFIIIDRLRPQL